MLDRRLSGSLPHPLPRDLMLRRFWHLAGGFWQGSASWRPRLVAAGLLGLSATEVTLLLRFNQWNRDLFDVLERRDGHGVLLQAGVLLVIALAFAIVSFLHLQARRSLALGWRAWLAQRLTTDWLGVDWLGAGGPTRPGGANADGRIAEDARIATEEAVELASSLAYAGMVLACFVGVLWTLSDHAPIPLGGIEFQLPGYLLWVAILFAGLGAAIPALLGRRLGTRHHPAPGDGGRVPSEALVRARDAGGAAVPRLGSGCAGCSARLAGAFQEQTAASAVLQFFCAASARLGPGHPLSGRHPRLASRGGDAGLGDAGGAGLHLRRRGAELAGRQHAAASQLAGLGRARPRPACPARRHRRCWLFPAPMHGSLQAPPCKAR